MNRRMKDAIRETDEPLLREPCEITQDKEAWRRCIINRITRGQRSNQTTTPTRTTTQHQQHQQL